MSRWFPSTIKSLKLRQSRTKNLKKQSQWFQQLKKLKKTHQLKSNRHRQHRSNLLLWKNQKKTLSMPSKRESLMPTTQRLSETASLKANLMLTQFESTLKLSNISTHKASTEQPKPNAKRWPNSVPPYSTTLELATTGQANTKRESFSSTRQSWSNQLM